MIVINRIIHPVGQGAFYTETIKTKVRRYNIVYDCGSTTTYKENSSKTILETEIKSFYDYKEKIDLLFISHFDNDHVNGLKHLKDYCDIKCVIMPLLPPSAMWFYLEQLDESSQQLIADPHKFFGEKTKIIRVKSTNGPEQERGELVLNDNEPSAKDEIVSGTIIQFCNLRDWCYIPLNFDEETRYEKLINILDDSNIDKEELLKGNIDYIQKHRADINKAYKKITKSGTSNDCSLIVYSGPTKTSHNFCRKYNYKWIYRILHNPYYYHRILQNPYYYHRDIPFEYIVEKVACLYLGDTDLNQTSQSKSKNKSKSKSLLDILSEYFENIRANIGLIQVPHHGSKHNFNKLILSKMPHHSMYFASFGANNTYGHPSYEVIANIEEKNYFIGVTEDRNSALVDTIFRGYT